MSSDQRPGKVRVFSSAAHAAPARRRGDRAIVVADPLSQVPDAPDATSEAARGAGTNWLALGLFLLGSAGGGALAAWLGLLPGGGL